MEYEVTATRKRPRSFDGLVGQEFVVASLKNSLESGRIAHAYLFSGPRGVGKTSAARILARALNCPHGPTAEPCDDFDGSEEIARGTAIDVIEIDGASNTSVNDVRQIKDEVLFAPTTARYKIYIIDEVHMLSNSAFNALLKTIEEPPPYIIFVFATTEIHKVPATIRSRCQQFTFRLIPTDLVAAKLREAAAELEIAADDEAVFWIAKESTGSLRDAYTLFDQVASFSEGHITLEKIRDKLGLVGFDNLNDIAEAIADGDGRKLVELTSETLARGVSVEQFVIDLAEYFRGVLFLRKGVRKEAVLGVAPDRFSAKLIRGLSDTQVERALELVLGLYRSIRYSLNQRFDLDLTMSRLASLRDYLTPQEVLDEIRTVREELEDGHRSGSYASSPAPQATGRPGPVAAGSTSAPEAGSAPGNSGSPEPARSGGSGNSGAPAISQSAPRGVREVTEVKPEQVAAMLDRIRQTRLALASALEKASEWNLADAELSIIFGNEYPANIARGEEEFLRTVAAEVLGRPVIIRIIVHSNRNEPEERDHSEQESQAEMVRRVFRGEIVE
jgi:DNA polymerase-3 subunit gamma/tau